VVDSVRGNASRPGGFLPSASPRPIDVTTAVVAFVGGWIVAQLAASLVLAALHGTGSLTEPDFSVTAAALVAMWASYLLAMYIASEREGSGSFVADYGLAFRAIDLLGLGVGVLANLVLIRLVYLPLDALWPDTFGEDKLGENARDLVDRADGASAVLLVLAVVVGAPLVEELFYRGLLQRSLAARFDEGLVVVAVALLFAVLHFRPVEIPGLFAVGLLFGVAALRAGRLGPAIMIHVGFNATGLLQAL
jgi:hypothetical protein